MDTQLTTHLTWKPSLVMIGNFAPTSTETQLAEAFQKINISLTTFQIGKYTSSEMLKNVSDVKPFVVMVIRTQGKPLLKAEKDDETFMQLLKDHDIMTIHYQLDLFIGIERELTLKDPCFNVTYMCSADGNLKTSRAMKEKYGIEHIYCKPGIASEFVYQAPSVSKDIDVLFIGTDSNYLKDWPYRQSLHEFLKKTYRDTYTLIEQGVRGHELNTLISRAKVIIGDTFCPDFKCDHYWSDRVYEILGRGGFMIHPYIAGMEEEFVDNKHLVYYKYGNFKDLQHKIDFYLKRPELRDSIQRLAVNYIRNACTYEYRMKSLLSFLLHSFETGSHRRKPLKVHIVTLPSPGLLHDADIVDMALKNKPFCFDVVKGDIGLLEDADMTIHFEQIPHSSKNFNVLIPNIEHTPPEAYGLADLVAARTRGFEEIIKLQHGNVCFISFGLSLHSDILKRSNFEDSYSVHACIGKSNARNLELILEAWRTYEGLPDLFLNCYDHNFEKTQTASPIHYYTDYLSNSELQYLRLKCPFSLCLSQVEGWGHYIHEAVLAGQILILTDAHPMNEMYDESSAVLVPASIHLETLGTNVSKGKYSSVTLTSVVQAVNQACKLSHEERSNMRLRALNSAQNRSDFFYEHFGYELLVARQWWSLQKTICQIETVPNDLRLERNSLYMYICLCLLITVSLLVYFFRGLALSRRRWKIP